MVSAKIILITIGIAALGIVILAVGISLQSLVENEPDNVPQWLQGVVEFGQQAGNITGIGLMYLGIAVIVGAPVFLFLFRNS